MNFLDRALPLIERGFSVIPLKPAAKDTLPGIGAKSRSRDPQQIQAWAEKFPTANVAIVADENFGILESDDYARFSELLKQSTGATIPKTLMACGSSENRPHLFFRLVANPENLVMPGLFELRAVNQYVVGAQSQHPNGSEYRWLNDASIATLTPALLAGLKHLAGEHKRGMAAVNLSDEKFPEGTRHYALLSLAGKLWDGKKTTDQLFDELWQFNLERCDPPKAEVLVRGIASHYVNRMKPFDPGPAVIVGAPPPAPIRDGSSRHFDFVLSPPVGGTDGAFALGSVHIMYGTSGSGKSTLGLQMLQAQAKGEPFFGHASYGRSFLYLMKDRGTHEMVRTLARMGAPDLPHATLPGGVNFTVAANAIRKEFFKAGQPEILFVEGLDMCLDDPCDPAKVGNFMELLMTFASDYHVSLIGTVGAPKSKPGEEYSMRDGAFGSTF